MMFKLAVLVKQGGQSMTPKVLDSRTARRHWHGQIIRSHGGPVIIRAGSIESSSRKNY
jgi:hypothetical protein